MNAAIARIREHIFSHTWEIFFPHLKDTFSTCRRLSISDISFLMSPLKCKSKYYYIYNIYIIYIVKILYTNFVLLVYPRQKN
jgi:hypothetical protein